VATARPDSIVTPKFESAQSISPTEAQARTIHRRCVPLLTLAVVMPRQFSVSTAAHVERR
jgi:hypothetical protein